MNPEISLRKLRQNPKKVINNARQGVLADLTTLADFWQEFPALFAPPVVMAVFFSHLDADKTPADPSLANDQSIVSSRAFASLAGLTKLGHFLQGKETYLDEISSAWPGIFKWSAFFYASRVKSNQSSPEIKRSAIDTIAGAWYSLNQAEKVCDMTAGTQGSVEIATQLWVLEDSGLVSSITNIPSCSASLGALLECYCVPGLLDRVVKSGGGSANNVAQLALSRLRTAINATPFREAYVAIYLDLIGHLSRKSNHALRYAFLHSNIIAISTKLILTASKLLHAGGNPSLIAVVVSAFGYLSNCLESTDGFTWVIQSLDSGLLLAFVECSSIYAMLSPEDRTMVFGILQNVLPKYLVYRSVVSAVDSGMKRAEQSPHKSKILGSPAKTVWGQFRGLALERLVVTMQAKAFKGKAVTCDNVKCHKVDLKNNFRKCSACQTTYYCSQECQTTAWKEGGHRSMCKMKQRERLEGKLQSISKSDAAFFHHLATRDARHHLPHLRRLAKQEWPETVHTEVVVCIDYTITPEKYSLLPLAGYERLRPQSEGSANEEARNEALIERAKENPGRFTLIQSVIANGFAKQLVLTVVTASFWDEGEGSWVEDDSYNDEAAPATELDSVDLVMGRMVLNGMLEKLGQPRTF